MCGFSGFISYVPCAKNIDQLLRAMGNTILTRGPDDFGCWSDASVGIGLVHQRLAILDLSPAGHQPMHSVCDRYVIVFNGEIYNHIQLRLQLQDLGMAPIWRGHSDTETLLACFAAWGIEKTLAATVGMFALALWDKERRILTLARDRMGEKPLYWGTQGDVLLFGSELKALKTHPAFKADIDRSALALLLRHNYIPAPYSIYQGIKKLPAGHYVNISEGKGADACVVVPYWSINSAIEAGVRDPFLGSDRDAVAALEARLSESIAGQMLADVPLGAFLSGGVDSSAVVALMQHQSQRPVQTFAIGFNETGYNEAEYARAVALHLGTDHTELYVGAQEALAVIPKLPSIYCEPFADSSQIPTFIVSQMARQYVTVALSGDAGDELFGGYNPYQFAPHMWRRLCFLPLPLRKAAVHFLSGMPVPEKLAKLLHVLDASSREEFYRVLLSHWRNPCDLVLMSQETSTLLSNKDAWPDVDSFEHWMMAMDVQTYMTDDILVKVDRAAMANSLETRIPMLDHRVVELAWRIPLNMKIRDGQGKWILREVLYKHVPRELIERPKKGFSIPIASWLRGPLREWAESLLDEHRLTLEGYFNVTQVRKAWGEHLKGVRDNSSRLWSILMFQAWLEVQHQ